MIATATPEEHSRFNEEHYRNCQECYEDHLDFMLECAMDDIIDNGGDDEEED